ncbi:MAG: pyridoxamine 5'-phosphate oxidase [Rhodothermales bacterium]
MSLLSTFRALATAGKGLVVGMPDATADADPIALFSEWFAAARKSGLFLPEALSLSTVSADGRPSSRMVLLKSADERGFVFYTNLESRKADEMNANPHVALLFHWPVLERQVRVEGRVEPVSREEAEVYFRSRPRGSRIGAWASRQSRRLGSRAELEQAVKDVEARYAGADVPLPEWWGGYLVQPERMEFWQGRPFRLHDRLVFTRPHPEAGTWDTERLYP